MTAEELHALPPDPPVPYVGGFTTVDAFGDDAVELQIGGDDGGVHLHAQIPAGVGGGLASMYVRLSASEAFELAGALVAAAQASDNLERENR